MISKPVPAHSFYHTCRYIAQKPGAEVLITEGVRGHDYKLMAADFEMQQQQRPAKHQACFHSILSFYPGEKPSDETMKDIALKYLQQLGIVNTQFAISKHTDKAHLHLHIVANMVNNQGKSISDRWIGLRGKKISQRLTQEYKLIPALEKNLKLTHLDALSQHEANKYKIYEAIAGNLPGCRSMEQLEIRLLKLGIETQYKYKGQTQEKQGISFRMRNLCFKGSQVDRAFSLGGLQKRIALQQKQVQAEQLTTSSAGNGPRQTLLPKQRLRQPHTPHQNIPGEKTIGPLIHNILRPERNEEALAHEFTEKAQQQARKKHRIHHY